MEPTTDIKKIIGISVVMIIVMGGIYAITKNGVSVGGTYWLSSNKTSDNQKADTQTNNTNDQTNMDETTKDTIKATITTDKGVIVLELYPKAAPKTVENFVTKAKAKYFDGLKFHRVEDWVIQGGDPLSRDASKEAAWGTGGGNIDTELSSLPFVEGALGVARGQDIKVSNDSQFFIVTKDSQFLNNQYTLFGQVTQGMDVVKKTTKGDTIISIVVQ